MVQLETLIQQIVNGLILGATYGLVGAGFGITYGISRVLNFAHGAFFVVGSYGVYALHTWLKLPLWAAFALGAIFVLPLALISYYLVIRPYGPEKGGTALLGTFAVALIVLEGCRLIFGGRALILPRLVDQPPMTLLPNVFLAIDPAIVFATGLAVLAVCLGILQWTGIGRRLRAIVQSAEAAQLIGIDPEPYRRFSFMSGSFLAAVAGSGLAILTPISIAGAVNMSFVAFVIVALAGLGNIGGAAIVGFALAIVQSLAVLYVRPEVSIAAPYLFMVLVLLVKPSGLFPTRA